MTGFIFIEADRIEEIPVVFILVDDMQSHLQIRKLKFNDKVDEDLVFHLSNREVLPTLPKLFGHPVGNDGHISKVVNIPLDIRDLLSKETSQPKFPPGGSLPILVYQSKRNDFPDSQVKGLVDINLFVLSHLFDQCQSIMCP